MRRFYAFPECALLGGQIHNRCAFKCTIGVQAPYPYPLLLVLTTEETAAGTPQDRRGNGGGARVRGEALSHHTNWNGKQWDVTNYGIGARDGTYAISRDRTGELNTGAQLSYNPIQPMVGSSRARRVSEAARHPPALATDPETDATKHAE